MSKSDTLFLELEEQAQALGFQDVGDACGHGYDIVGTQLVKSVEAEMAEAHNAWRRRKEEVIADLANISDQFGNIQQSQIQGAIERAIEFINECEGKI